MLSKNLVRLRKEKGFSQTELADLIGISRQQLSKYEMGLIEPSLENIRRLAKTLMLTTLLGDTGQQRISN